MLNIVFGASGASLPVTNLHIELRTSRQLKMKTLISNVFKYSKHYDWFLSYVYLKRAITHESYIDKYVGLQENGDYGNIYFNKTLNDWSKFNINNRTLHDASISSGLAIMACNKNRYRPTAERKLTSVPLGFKKYDNKGVNSKILN